MNGNFMNTTQMESDYHCALVDLTQTVLAAALELSFFQLFAAAAAC